MPPSPDPLPLAEIERRDRAVRSWLTALDWRSDPELELMRQVVARSREWFPHAPYFLDHEWNVVDGESQHGKGDLLLTDGQTLVIAVETKWVTPRTGRTAKGSRRKSRRKVEEQAATYARAAARLFLWADAVEGWYVTNDLVEPRCQLRLAAGDLLAARTSD